MRKAVGTAGVVFVCAVLVVIAATTFYFESINTWKGTGTITAANSWRGGDLQYYYNATITTPVGSFSHIFTCDYYTVGSHLLVKRDFSGWGILTLSPIGCGN